MGVMGESIHRSRRSECVNAAVADKIDVAPRRSRTMDIQQANPSHWSTYQLSCRGVCDHVVLGQHPMWVWQGDIAAVDAGVHLKLVAQAFLAAACMIYGSHGWMDGSRAEGSSDRIMDQIRAPSGSEDDNGLQEVAGGSGAHGDTVRDTLLYSNIYNVRGRGECYGHIYSRATYLLSR
jgi:hypothetical protein